MYKVIIIVKVEILQYSKVVNTHDSVRFMGHMQSCFSINEIAKAFKMSKNAEVDTITFVGIYLMMTIEI